jgi:cytochrome c-type biogenesis protein CcmH
MRLLREVRCLSCRNASLADASSHEARDQRREILDLINANYSDDDIRKYLRARYGARALYRPDTEADTMLLWLTPIVIQSLGGLFFLRAIFRQCKRPINL